MIFVFQSKKESSTVIADTEEDAWNGLYWEHRDISDFELLGALP